MLDRRQFITHAGLATAGLTLASCSKGSDRGYAQSDIDALARQQERELVAAGKGPHGPHVYPGYKGLSELPWFDLDEAGQLVCIDDTIPRAIDVHCHLGMESLLQFGMDHQAETERVQHALDCDGVTPPCSYDLDVYTNGNFTPELSGELERSIPSRILSGDPAVESQTIPNLVAEMDAMRVDHSFVLPIKFGLPFADNRTEDWRKEVSTANATDRLSVGFSVHPRDGDRIEQMREHAANGTKLMKIHPTIQQFYPDAPDMMPIYEEAQKLGIVVFIHAGRAGIEPPDRQKYLLPRYYEAMLKNFPNLQVILGHSGARDAEAMIDIALPYKNAWFDIHGQGISMVEKLIRKTDGERMLFGTDWPWYHIGAHLAKVLICTDTPEREKARSMILRENALSLFPELARSSGAVRLKRTRLRLAELWQG